MFSHPAFVFVRKSLSNFHLLMLGSCIFLFGEFCVELIDVHATFTRAVYHQQEDKGLETHTTIMDLILR